MKKNYIKPVSELIVMKSEGLMLINSIDNTGQDGADKEKQTGIHENYNSGLDAGSKENNMWDNSYNVWE